MKSFLFSVIHTSNIHFDFDKRLIICILSQKTCETIISFLIIWDSSVLLERLILGQSNFCTYIGQFLYDTTTQQLSALWLVQTQRVVYENTGKVQNDRVKVSCFSNKIMK